MGTWLRPSEGFFLFLLPAEPRCKWRNVRVMTGNFVSNAGYLCRQIERFSPSGLCFAYIYRSLSPSSGRESQDEQTLVERGKRSTACSYRDYQEGHKVNVADDVFLNERNRAFFVIFRSERVSY